MIVILWWDVEGEVRRESAVCRPVMPAPTIMMFCGLDAMLACKVQLIFGIRLIDSQKFQC